MSWSFSWLSCGSTNNKKKDIKKDIKSIKTFSKQEILTKYEGKTIKNIRTCPNQYHYFWFLLSKGEYWDPEMSSELKNSLFKQIDINNAKIVNVSYNSHHSWLSVEIEF
jgi:hypothetical protein